LALARAMLKATDYIRNTPNGERCDAPIHLLAHSMGNWTLRGAVQAMRAYVGYNIPPLFDEVLLMAGDEDDDTLAHSHKLAPLLRGCRRVTVYYNQQDLALKASDVAMGNPDRLGRSGPNGVREVVKIVPVNVSAAVIWNAEDWTQDETGHQYYRNNKIVRDDVAQVLQGKLDADISGRKRRDEGYYRLG
jgi:esterase/lipase superfamily enzyme